MGLVSRQIARSSSVSLNLFSSQASFFSSRCQRTIFETSSWHQLGYCDEMTKREALRHRDDIMRDVNREVYTIKSHVSFKPGFPF